jgi:C-methyltransferase C-terminal domain/Putative zinc binding domain/Methyltransferase domain
MGQTQKAVCRFCATPLSEVFADLGVSPLANSYLGEDQLSNMEPHFPLKAWVCGACFLVQLEEFESPAGIFSEYAYFSSFSTSWLAHAERYVRDMIARFGFDSQSQVVEIASNDGYLLQYFHAAGVPVLGIEPAANVAQAAIAKGIPSRTVFFGRDTAREIQADLLLGNNVYAHVPDLHSFTEGLKIALKPEGVITLEFPHLLRLMDEAQFDTIYHEHFSYFSLLTVQKVFERHGLTVFDVEELPTHGGSLRIFGKHAGNTTHAVTPRVEALIAREKAAGLDGLDAYRTFAEKVIRVKCDLLEFLIDARRQGKIVAGYGAPAKGNTLLNYCGVGPELLPFTVDRSPHKQGQYLPGTRIPIRAPEALEDARPDYILILPWNLKDEITDQMSAVRQWGGRFVVAIPSLEVLP